MTQYRLSVHNDGTSPSETEAGMQQAFADTGALNEEMRASYSLRDLFDAHLKTHGPADYISTILELRAALAEMRRVKSNTQVMMEAAGEYVEPDHPLADTTGYTVNPGGRPTR